MSNSQLGAYTFLPWVRRGLARALKSPDDPGAVLASQATLPVGLRVDGTGPVTTSVRLHGPGDVTGLDPRQVISTDPVAGAISFEPGSMPSVQFASPDLPWLFTPAAPGARGRLRPWLCLVVVRRQDGVSLGQGADGGPAVLRIEPPARARDELPDLGQSWAWAHVQIAGVSAGQTPADILRVAPQRGSSRLICPRRLAVATSYVACVVPAFRVGVEAGLGEPPDPEANLEPAWAPDRPDGSLRLPVYYSWQFTTAADGSFETLARRLRPSPLDPESVRPPRLDLTTAGAPLPAVDPDTPGAVVGMQSALRVPEDDTPPPWADETRIPIQAALERLLTTALEDTITAPLYGAEQAAAERLPPTGEEPDWLRTLNLDPRLRAAAAVGTRVVQRRQEQLMAAAWEQVGAIREANALLRRAQLARELGGTLLRRHLLPLSPDELLAVTQPAHAGVRIADDTLHDELRASRIPVGAVSGAMRRLATPQGLLSRRARAAEPTRPRALLAAVDRVAIAPAPVAPAGMVALAGAPDRPALPAAKRPALPTPSLRAQLLERLRPHATVLHAVRARIDAPADTWTRSDPLAPVAIGPEFREPMYDGLRQEAPRLFSPDLEQVASDGVALFETSPLVIEAYMAGLNHEIGRELLWREFPCDLTVSPFRQFWDVRGQPGDPESLADIPPLSEWADRPLGAHLRGSTDGGQLVLVVRGELLRRYPTTTIYAAPAGADGSLDAAGRLPAMFRGFASGDVTFVGFALTEEAALGSDPPGPGWYFVFEQYPGAPRFGFDEQSESATPATSDELAWTHVAQTPSGHADLDEPLSGAGPELQAAWQGDAATIAGLALQRPFRVAIHASRLLETETPP